jgi:DNA-binding IclR family transcriptional regulator
MNDDDVVLGTMLRLARNRVAANPDELFERVGLNRARIRASLARLDSAGFVERRSSSGARLTMTGLAVALASRPKRNQNARTGRRAGRHAA